jgi:thioredoxin
VLLAGYARWAARRDQPALDLSLARRRVPAPSMGLCALASVVTWAAVFLLPVFVQSGQGRSALAAGLAMAPQGLVTGLSAALGPRLLARLTVRVTVLCGFAVLAVASLGLLLVAAATPLWLIAVILACRAVSIGLVIAPLLQALTEPLRPGQLGDANTLFNTWQRVAGSFGIGLVAAPYATQARLHGQVAALHFAGAVMAALCLAGLLITLALPGPRTAGQARKNAAGADDSTFSEVAEAAKIPVVVDLWAPWCGPCRTVSPALEQLARDLADKVKLVKVNVDTSPQTPQRFGVQAIPTLLVLRRGQVTARQTGAVPLAALRGWVDSALATVC